VRELQEIGIESLYHSYRKEQQGKETQPTFFLHRNREKSYHIDYCFASMNFIDLLKEVTVCNYEDWKHLSDHSPMAITLGN
jgi:endonuclease/exonuclease/phosphatase family metal-dependent hydrolase